MVTLEAHLRERFAATSEKRPDLATDVAEADGSPADRTALRIAAAHLDFLFGAYGLNDENFRLKPIRLNYDLTPACDAVKKYYAALGFMYDEEVSSEGFGMLEFRRGNGRTAVTLTCVGSDELYVTTFSEKKIIFPTIQ